MSDLRHLTDAVNALSQNVTALERSIQRQHLEIAEVRTRESQLRAIAQRNLELAGREQCLDALLHDSSLAPHVAGAIAEATLRERPFPHAVVGLLPGALYDALIAGLPPVELFADRPANKQQLLVPFDLAPDYSRRVWQFMSDVVVREMITPAVAEKFVRPLGEWLRQNFVVTDSDPLAGVSLVCSDGRILLRTNGYRIPPHRDPKWGFLTGIMYLARPGDDKRWGTDLYEVDKDREAKGAAPHWIEAQHCRRVDTIGFRRNRALLFLNSTGAHGAEIPADVESPPIQRYVYQFRIGPDAESMAALTGSLPPERRAYWEGKQRTY